MKDSRDKPDNHDDKNLLRNVNHLESLLKTANEKIRARKKWFGELKSDLKSMINLVRAWAKGEYRAIPLKSLAAAVSAIVYFVNPFDLLPDPLLFGFVDDAMVVGYVLSSLKSDLNAFNQWKLDHRLHF